MLQIARPNRGGSHYQRAIGNRFSYGFIFFRAGQHVRGAHSRAGAFKRHIIGIHHSQMAKSKVAHRPGGRSDVKGIAHVHQDDAQIIEFSGKRQYVRILRQSAFVASLWPHTLFTSWCKCKKFVKPLRLARKWAETM